MKTIVFRKLRVVFAIVALTGLLAPQTLVWAGTTGQIVGSAVDSTTKKPIVGAKVTASSPSAAQSTTTDAAGRFTFLQLPPDTYSVSLDKNGYAGASLNGVTVTADQVQNLSLRAAPALQVIGRTQSRAASDLIKPGQTADVYSINAAAAGAAAPLGGGGSLNQAYSAIASVPGVYVPTSQVGWAQSVYVRGGNYTQLGYEFDGVPVQRAYDAYPASTLSALGTQETQVYTGSQPGDAQSNGLAGFVNQVIKTGTYPGTGSLDFGLGTPAFYHKAQFEYGGSTADRNFSYYFATAGYNQAQRTIDQFDGTSVGPLYQNLAVASISNNCGTPQATAGCYKNTYDGAAAAPNGWLVVPGNYGAIPYVSDRESVANFHIGLPHKKDGLKDDIQLLADISSLGESYNDSFNAYGGFGSFFSTGVLNYGGKTYQTCADQFALNAVPCVNNYLGVSGSNFNYSGRSIYTGPTGGALTAANLGQVSPYAFPASPNASTLSGPVPLGTNGNEYINNAIFKVQYTHPLGANAFARIYGYSLYSAWLNNDPNGGWAEVPTDYILPTHTRGLGMTLADQLGSHTLNLTGGYSFANLSRWNNSLTSTSNPVALLVDSTAPANGLCYSAALAAVSCYSSSAARYVIPGTNVPSSSGLQPKANGAINVGNASTFSCGGGPCEFLTVGSGLNGSYNNVSPRFGNFTLSDDWRVSNKLSFNGAVRYDSFYYGIPSGTTPEGPNPPGTASAIGRTALTNSYNAFNCFTVATGITAAPSGPNSCPAGTQVAFSNNNSGKLWYGGFEPRIGATYQLDSLSVLRAGYGRYLQPSSTAYVFYNRAGADVAGYDAPKFYAYGYTTPQHDIPPEESWNLDASWEHQFKGSDVSFKLSPFYRKTRNEDINVILDPITNFTSAIPALSGDVKGIELEFRKGDFNRNGFAAQLAYTYTYATTRFQTLPGGFTALDNVNTSVKQYNAYTSFCATHPTDARCGTPTSGVAAARCYTAAGAADAACATGSIANPYWNAPVQALFDPNATYYPFNQTFGTGYSSNASAYSFPHIAALILNYKHNKFNITPSLQFEAGGRYGSPVQGVGIDPAAGCAALAGTTTGDPRYPYGAGGGAPYDAQSCTGSLTAPNPYTGRFDTPGQFVEPSQLLANIGIGYQVRKNVTLNLLAVNVFGTCFGGSKQAWTNAGNRIGCWYSSGSGYQAGNFYNPGNALSPLALPYSPVIGQINGQQSYATNVQPFTLVLSAQIKL